MMFYVSASHDRDNPTRPSSYQIHSAYLDTKTEAEVIAHAFPKASKATVVTVTGPWKGNRYSVQSWGKLASDDVNKGRNETAIARYRKTMAIIDNFFASTWEAPAKNSYPSRTEFETALS